MFGLILSAIGYIGIGVIVMTGAGHGVEKEVLELLYLRFSSLKTVDTLMGLAYFALAAALVWVRFQMSGFKKDAPKRFLILQACCAILPLFYNLILYLIFSNNTGLTAEEIFDKDSRSQMIGSVIGTVGGTVINYKYYKKREHLFIN